MVELKEKIDNIFNDEISKLINRQKRKGKDPTRHDIIQVVKRLRLIVRREFGDNDTKENDHAPKEGKQ